MEKKNVTHSTQVMESADGATVNEKGEERELCKGDEDCSARIDVETLSLLLSLREVQMEKKEGSAEVQDHDTSSAQVDSHDRGQDELPEGDGGSTAKKDKEIQENLVQVKQKEMEKEKGEGSEQVRDNGTSSLQENLHDENGAAFVRNDSEIWKDNVIMVQENDANLAEAVCLHDIVIHARKGKLRKMQEDLKTSGMECQASVLNPVPDVLRIAQGVLAGMRQTDKKNVIDLVAKQTTSFQERWDDSTDGTKETSNRVRLAPSPQRTRVLPQWKQETEELGLRRKNRRWNLHEEDILRKAVAKYGDGNWKLILDLHHDVFEKRTQVDLKDKWRNLTSFGRGLI